MLQKKKMHALFCLYYVVIYEFKYESKMIKLSRLVLVGRDKLVKSINWIKKLYAGGCWSPKLRMLKL